MKKIKEHTQITATENMSIVCCVCNETINLLPKHIFFVEPDNEDKKICFTCSKKIADVRRKKEVSSLKTVAFEAKELVNQRRKVYGSPFVTHYKIARLWNAYLNGLSRPKDSYILSPGNVAIMMILLKIARLEETPYHRDSVVDIIGYAECYAEIMGIKTEEETDDKAVNS